MATKTVTKVVCDRCNRDIEMAEGESVDYNPNAEPLIVISQKGSDELIYKDLCKKCDKRVAALVKDIGPLSFGAKSENGNDDDHSEDEDEDGDVKVLPDPDSSDDESGSADDDSSDDDDDDDDDDD